MIESTINMLFIGTRYLVWGMGIIGIPLSIILLLANINGGIGAIALMLAALCLSIAVTLLLMPNSLNEKLPEIIQERRFAISGVLVFIAMALAGLTYFISGGFPSLNLLFIKI